MRPSTACGSVVASVRVREPVHLGPSAPGMSSQYWFWALTTVLEQGEPGSLDASAVAVRSQPQPISVRQSADAQQLISCRKAVRTGRSRW